MKQIAPNYTYNKTTGVITLSGLTIDRDQLLLVVNTTRNVTYYNFADSATTLQSYVIPSVYKGFYDGGGEYNIGDIVQTNGNPYGTAGGFFIRLLGPNQGYAPAQGGGSNAYWAPTSASGATITLNASVVSSASSHNNADALTIYYDDQVSSGVVNVLGRDANGMGNNGLGATAPIPIIAYDEGIGSAGFPYVVPVQVTNVGGQISETNPLPIVGTVTNVGLNELPYIKANIAITKPGFSLTTNVFLRRISQYKYESIRYQGGEDEAYVQIELKQAGTDQLVWKASYLGGFADWEGEFAFAFPQNKGNDTGDAFPPATWIPVDGFTGTTTVSYEQPSTQPISGTVTANASLTDFPTDNGVPYIPIAFVDSPGGSLMQVSRDPDSGLPISGTVNANLAIENDFVTIGEEIAQGIINKGTIPISGTVTANAGGETPTSGTATLTNDTRWELNTEGFGHIAFEIVSTGAGWAQPQYGIVAQAYNGTAPSNNDIFAPAGIRYRHSTDGATLNQALNNFYYNLNIAPNTGNGYGTSLIRIDGNTATYLGLPSTGTRYFLFDLTTSRFALRPNFTAGTAQVKYRLYKGKHPFFSARNVIVRGENTDGKINVTVPDGISANVVYAIQDGDGTTFGVDRDFPISGTVTASNAGWKLLGARNWNGDQSSLILDTTGYSELRFQSFTAGAVTSYLTVLSPTNGEDYYWSFQGTLSFNHNVTTSNQYVGNMYVNINEWDENENQTTLVYGRTSVGTVLAYVPQGLSSVLSNFTSVTTAPLVGGENNYSGRSALTVFNEGPGTLYIGPKNTTTTSSYMVRLSAGEYWECPAGSMAPFYHAVFGSAGTARVTQIY